MKKFFTQNTKIFFLPGSNLIFVFTILLALLVSAPTTFASSNFVTDTDGDGIFDDQDNCINTYNPVQADYDNDGIGDVCDNDHDCDKITSIKRVLNMSSSCSSSNHERVIWMNGALCKEIGDLYFVEYDNGTATLKGRVQEYNGGNISYVDVTFTGKTNSGNPYFDCATQAHADDWYYYSDFSGTIGGLDVVPNPAHGFQVGFGANVKNDTYGASGWFKLDGVATDFNFDLSDPLTCAIEDADEDGIADADDNCVNTFNPIQADYDNDGIGDVCDTEHDCDKILSIKRVLNMSSSCSSSDDKRVIWMNGTLYKEIGDLYFVEYDNGTATLKGSIQEYNGSNISIVDVTFTGKTNSGNPYFDCATQAHADDWYYYSDFSGTIGGLNVVPNPAHGFQVGLGANVKNDTYGASGWFKLDGIATDFNFDLSDPLPCAFVDADQDGIADADDNCVNTFNPVQADYDNDGIGDVCDTEHDCEDIISIKRVLNLSSSCSSANHERVIWMNGALCKEIGDLYFVEYANGTATLKGRVQELNGGNINYIDVLFTDRNESGNPYVGCADDSQSSDWYYYDNFSGHIGGMNIVPNPDHPFQVGFGANVKNDAYGASGWFKADGINTDFNFDLSDPLPCASKQLIGDRIFLDTNGNGIQDNGEEGLPNVIVQLYSAGNDGTLFTADDVVERTEGTDQDGFYQFQNVDPGTYYLRIDQGTLPIGYGFTFPDQGGNDVADSDFNQVGTSEAFTVVAGQAMNLDFDAGILLVGSIGNKVWLDENANGILDATEPGLPGVFVFLEDEFGMPIENLPFEYTDASGSYLFKGIPLGKYIVRFATPTGFSLTSTDANMGNDDSLDSDASIIDGKSHVILLTEENADDLTIDAGYVVPIKVGGYVWEDDSQEGTQDPSELDVEGMVVRLYSAGPDMIAGTNDDALINTTSTDEFGAYLFTNVGVGKYFVNFDLASLLPLEFAFSDADTGSDDTIDSDADISSGNTPVFMMTSGVDVFNLDAGLIATGSLPVSLIRFTADKFNCITQLQWTSETEENFSHYELEYSKNSINYDRIDIIGAEGGRGVQHYFAKHTNTAEQNYYRLKMVDLDGTFEYSDVVFLQHDCNATAGMSIFPNPVNQEDANIQVKFFSNTEATNVHIIDGMGRIISSHPYTVDLEWNVVNLDVSDLNVGIYYIMIDDNREAGRFIITE